MASRPARQSTALLRFEQLERRELMAGNVGLDSIDREAGGICGPVPLSELVATTQEDSTPSPGAAEHLDLSQGNITAQVVDGVLIIRGDGLGNRFKIYGYGGFERYVDGIFWIGDAEQENQKFYIVPGKTLVNGQQLSGGAIQSIAFTGVTAIDIDLGDGDDWLEIHAIQAPELTIRTGNGNDEVILRGLMPARVAYYDIWQEYPPIEGPMGGLRQAPLPLRVDGDLFIDTGVGADRLSPFAAVEGDATVQLGTGDNSYIEVPYQLNQIWLEKDPVTGQYPAPERVIGKLTASGELSIDWGADQDVENIPANWQDDPHLVSHVQRVPGVLAFYQGMVERGEATPGTAQLISLPQSPVSGRIDAEGRLEIEFGFTPGLGRAIERLQARGVTLDAYSIVRGMARAVIREEDLKLFANLPGIGYFQTYLYTHPSVIDPEWDYVRPGSSTAELAALTPPPEFGENVPISPVTTSPVIGPSPLQDVSAQATGVSLRDWYYSNVLMGPEPLQ